MVDDKVKPPLSVVIPVRNEEQSIDTLYRKLTCALEAHTYEIIFVDDASNDGSWEVLKKLRVGDSRLKIVRFAKHSGQTAALAAGFSYAAGDMLATLDADLQNDPVSIPLLMASLAEGYDLAVGWRRLRRDPFLRKVVPSLFANLLIRIITGIQIHDVGCTLKVFKKKAAESIIWFRGAHRFIPLLARDKGFRITEIEVPHYPRKFGKSKYGLGRMFSVAFDLVMLRLAPFYLLRAKPLRYVLKEVIL